MLPSGSNQDLLRSAGGIFVLGSWFWFEPRFAQESWGNLGSCILVLVRTKICSGVLGESWFLVLVRTKIGSGVLGKSWFLVLAENAF